MLITELAEARHEGPAGRPHHRAGHRRGRRREPHARPRWRRSSSCWSWPATRPPATPSPTGSSPSPSTPTRWRRWQADFDGLAADRGRGDRALGHAGDPLPAHRAPRTARASATSEFKEGDKVVLWYASANRDAAVFDDPFRFDLGRTPNDHLGFGGPGPALLPRRPPGPPGDHRDVPRAVPAHARHPRRRRARRACSRTSSTASSTCRRPGRPRPPA